jgi:Fe-S cluster assembly protein SufB
LHENATIKYSTVQNWYSGNEFGKGGVYNFVTKRLCAGSKYHGLKLKRISYYLEIPSCLLVGDNSQGEFYSVALTNNYQQADTGMTHIGKIHVVALSQKVSQLVNLKIVTGCSKCDK